MNIFNVEPPEKLNRRFGKKFSANRTHTDSPVFSGWTDLVQTVLSEGNSSAVLKIMIRGLNYEDL